MEERLQAFIRMQRGFENATVIKLHKMPGGASKETWAFYVKLTNAKTDQLQFDCGLGSAELDFGGATLRDMDIEVNVGLGSVTLVIPEAYNVEMEAEENFLSSIDTRGLMKTRRGFYRSRNQDPSQPTLRITASVGLGSIDIRWSD